MKVIAFRSKDEHSDLMKKVKKMKKFTEELEDLLEECMDDEDIEFRRGGSSYRKEWDEEEMPMSNGRYNYRRMGGRG